MGAFGGATPKRHRLWSNCNLILAEISKRGTVQLSNVAQCFIYMCQKKTPVPCIGGHLSREVLRSLPGVKDGGLVRKYIDKSGKKRHVGVAAKLKQSQRLCCTYLLMCMGCTVRLQI